MAVICYIYVYFLCGAVVYMDYMYNHMIGNGSPGLVGLSTQGAVVYMDYMYNHMIGNGSLGLVGLSTHSAVIYMDYM